jgi:hypothetical protein
VNKTAIAVAAAAFALSGTAGMVVPAQASPAHSAGSATSGSSAACAPRTVDTRTNLVLDKHFVHRGDANGATVHVRSAGAVDPRGTVELAIYQSQSGTGFDGTLSNGMVRFAMPRHLDVGSYDVRATYIPQQCSKWKRSLSTVEHLTVLAN